MREFQWRKEKSQKVISVKKVSRKTGHGLTRPKHYRATSLWNRFDNWILMMLTRLKKFNPHCEL